MLFPKVVLSRKVVLSNPQRSLGLVFALHGFSFLRRCLGETASPAKLPANQQLQ